MSTIAIFMLSTARNICHCLTKTVLLSNEGHTFTNLYIIIIFPDAIPLVMTFDCQTVLKCKS